MRLSKYVTVSGIAIISIAILSLVFPLISYSDFISIFKDGARVTRVGDGTAVGNLSGKFSVDPSGSAVYDIPISAPPGTAKMAPDLSLHYDSSGGNGILGMGFSLQGLTAITRVPSNMAQNGVIHGVDFSSLDRFALNGQQLVSTEGTYGADGTEYRTYIDSQARIVSQGTAGAGPAGFVVQTKGGQTAWYGTTPDSQILANGPLANGAVALFALSKIQDAAGNTIAYHYISDSTNGSYYPSEIDYTSNDNTSPKVVASNAIKFIYDSTPRPDPITNYTSGSLFKTTQRLVEIQTYQGSTLVSDYKISYETSPNTFRSRITSIQQCDGGTDGKGTNQSCFRPLQFTWQTNQMGWQEDATWKPLVPISCNVTGGLQDCGTRFGDMQGTGQMWMLQSVWRSGSGQSVGSWIASPTLASNSHWQSNPIYIPPASFESTRDDGSLGDFGSRLVDLTGDGRLDFINNVWWNGQEVYSRAYLNNGKGWTEATSTWGTPWGGITANQGGDMGMRFMDLRGTGRPDYLQGT